MTAVIGRIKAFSEEEFMAMPSVKKQAELFRLSQSDYCQMLRMASPLLGSKAIMKLRELSNVRDDGGWKLVDEWDGLFSLYKRGNEFTAELSASLEAHDLSLQKANVDKKGKDLKYGKKDLDNLQIALFFLSARERERKTPRGLRPLDIVITQLLTHTIGSMLSEALYYIPKRKENAVSIRAGESKSGGTNKATELKRFFSRAIDGLMKMKYPENSRGAGKKLSRNRLAIECARRLCGHWQRLPTKSEVRFFMEVNGESFSERSKGVDGRWRKLFMDSGLETLKD